MTRRLALLLSLVVLFGTAPGWGQEPAAADNPLLKEWKTPFQVPPFQEIQPDHFLPAFKVAIAENRREIEAIANGPQPATFANTVEALERAGQLLSRISGVFGALQGAETNARLQAINREVTPMLSALRDEVRLNETLFARVKAVYEVRESCGLTAIQQKLVEDTYKGYVRAGANLDPAKKDALRKINAELSMLSVKFGDNLLHDTNDFTLVIDRREDLAGLPASVVAMGADAAKAAGTPGKWVYTLHAPSIWPFLQYADNRELRRRVLDAYLTRGDHGDQYDNKKIVSRIAALRVERANLLGYKSHADFVLEENMAKTPAGVYGLLNQLWTPAREMALNEAAVLQDQIKAEGGDFTLAPADWRYYAEKVRKAKYDLDDQQLRPYFQLDQVQQGAFYVANRLYGITFTPRPDLPVYHPEVKAWEVKDADGTHLSVFYTDYHPRPGKRVGAWSGRMRGSWVRDGKSVRPIATNVCNFSRPAGDEPALLTLEEVGTLFHELGHAIATFLSKVPYTGLGGVPRDFVEVPSQIMENWALEPEVLKAYAKHYKTGEVIPAALVEKIRKSAQFNQGFATVEYLAASLLDMDWHTLTTSQEQDVAAFEKAALEKIGNPTAIPPRYRSPYYNHIWASGYSAGYYAYIWSEVLDKDAFQAFKETSLFDQATAKRFRTEILEKGGSEDAMTMYKRFRGKEPGVDALLKARGLK
jgi:peptidyl-dipeptidase Dcp